MDGSQGANDNRYRDPRVVPGPRPLVVPPLVRKKISHGNEQREGNVRQEKVQVSEYRRQVYR